jgi:hypothetical protein
MSQYATAKPQASTINAVANKCRKSALSFKMKCLANPKRPGFHLGAILATEVRRPSRLPSRILIAKHSIVTQLSWVDVFRGRGSTHPCGWRTNSASQTGHADFELIIPAQCSLACQHKAAKNRKRIYRVNGNSLDASNETLDDLFVASAAAALGRLPRKRKRQWSGWLHGKHLRRDDLVVVPDGQVRRIFGAVRGSVIVLKYPIPERGLPAEIFRAEDLRLYKNPNAVIIGSLKRGRKEARSQKKIEACRHNGCEPPRPGSRPRGRPRKGVSTALAG